MSDELLGGRLCLRRIADGRCHEYLTREGNEFRCRVGHRWSATAQTLDPPRPLPSSPPPPEPFWRFVTVVAGGIGVGVAIGRALVRRRWPT